MEFKGTKGEWTTGLYPNLNHPHRTVLTTENQKEICTIHLDNIEVRANAKLIAAAPKLLEALIELKIMAEGNNQYAFELAEEAINKALGL
jgi:hypothetical protein